MKFNLPAKCEIIFFDVVDQIILKIFKQKKSTIINLRLLRKDLNFFIFFKIFMSLKLIKILFKEGFLISYVASYIRYCESKRVITCVDNNIRFYRLKHYFRNIKFISIQNGLRHKFMDIFGNPNLDNNLKCDEILVFGNSIKKKYLNYIDAKIKTVGCFRNNNYKVFKLKKKKTVLFISQFRNFPHNKMMEHFGKKIITWGEMNSNLSFLLPNILSYCKKKKFKVWNFVNHRISY